MQTQAIEKFSMWARNKLREGVEQRAYDYALDSAAPNAEPKDATTVNGRVLSNEERAMRTELAGRIERDGYAQFVEEMAYTWFNRMVAIRFMELHDYLPSHVRIFSSAEDGAKFSPQALSEALTVAIDGLDRDRVFACMDAADDEALFRELLLAQCNELAGFLPRVFGRVGGADALMLPANLLKPEGVPAHMVGDIPVELWDDVEILGWMYQFYNAELKADFLSSKRKASPEDLAPATQIFTPDWIVRYKVDNTLGRLWMLNHPDSHLPQYANEPDSSKRLMEFFIKPDEDHEEFIRIASPEDITFCDPACGSGHILVYAFKMLIAIYEESGYRARDIPELILTKNLSGMEIDRRAAQFAELELVMSALKYDLRFLRRGAQANISLLHDVDINADALSLTSPLRQKPELLDTLAHLGEVGSLFAPTSDDIAALEADQRESMTDDIFAAKANENVQTALNLCKALYRRFDLVVANPPYLGSSKFNTFMSKWVGKHYPNTKNDLCTAFIERIMHMLSMNGLAGITGTNSWMFLSSFEALRNMLIDQYDIVSLVQLSVHGFKGIAAQVCTGVFSQAHTAGARGAYVRLNDFDHHSLQESKTLEAIHNPTCGWFYRADATTFHDIPGSPIAYWASEAVHKAFHRYPQIGTWLTTREGMATANNDLFVRDWWESAFVKIGFDIASADEATKSKRKWFPYQKGGDFRKWFGNNELVVNWENDGYEIKSNVDRITGRIRSHNYNGAFAFREGITWSSLSSGKIHLRFSPTGALFDSKGAKGFADSTEQCLYALALLNSSVAGSFLSFLAPTLDFKVGDVIEIPDARQVDRYISYITGICIDISRNDYDSQETSWDFKRSPLV